MSAAAEPLTNPTPSAPPPLADDALAYARALIAEQLPVLTRMIGAGAEVALDIERQARESAMPADPPAPRGGELALAYSRVSRAVRMTVALQSKLIAHLQALEDAAAARAAGIVTAREALEADRVSDHKTRIARIVERVAKDACDGDEDEADRLYTEACDRLDDDDIYGEVMSRPMSEMVAEVCRDIGLEPDWERLSREAWAKAERSALTAPIAAAMAGGGPSAEEPMVVGEGPRHHPSAASNPWRPPPSPSTPRSSPGLAPGSAGGPPPAAFSGGGDSWRHPPSGAPPPS